jgi:hypothetical protein
MIKLSRSCYAIKYVKHFTYKDMLRTIYFSYFHFKLSYGIILWGNFAYSCGSFKFQKRIITVIMNARNRDSCCQLFKNLKILPLQSKYFYSLLFCIVKNRDLYESNTEIHNINTRFISDLHTLTANLINFQKVPFILELKSLITFLLASKIHLMT